MISDFWRQKPLAQLSLQEWEQLCDRCGKCCTLKLEDENTGVVYDTHVVCRYFDLANGLCQCYQTRSSKVPECVRLTPDNLGDTYFMPQSCAYRLLYEGKELPPWHHLISHDRQTIHRAHQSVLGKVISESDLNDALEHHLTDVIQPLADPQ